MPTNQAHFGLLVPSLLDLETHFSRPRLSRYLDVAQNDLADAMRLYRWNAALSQSIYWSSQTAEIVTRNAICRTLQERYGPDWIRSSNFRSIAKRGDVEKIEAAITRQRQERKLSTPSVDQVVADLSFGFWVSILANHYAVPVNWQRGLRKSFPNIEKGATLDSIRILADNLRTLRNRVAHHEPIFQLPLEAIHRNILLLTKWASPSVYLFVTDNCRFAQILEDKPDIAATRKKAPDVAG
jgi:hypothetical protein